MALALALSSAGRNLPPAGLSQLGGVNSWRVLLLRAQQLGPGCRGGTHLPSWPPSNLDLTLWLSYNIQEIPSSGSNRPNLLPSDLAAAPAGSGGGRPRRNNQQHHPGGLFGEKSARIGAADAAGCVFSPKDSFPRSIGLSPVAPTRALGRLDREPPPGSGRGGRGLLGSAPAAGELGKPQKRERERRRWQHPGENLLGAEEKSLLARAARGRGVPALPPQLDTARDQVLLGERQAKGVEPEPGGLCDSGRRAAGAGGPRGAGFPQSNPPETQHLLLDRPLRPPRRAGLDLAEQLPPGPGLVSALGGTRVSGGTSRALRAVTRAPSCPPPGSGRALRLNLGRVGR
ncbi:uncharacterized protein LOC141917400 isoform X1 [Strix aluco]|uniref:uncharacterized protein LOC141917400 isoform X1 n=1 Tax=Strix aluco TaxID=111821 RepID=UPI003DA6C7A8